MGAYDNIPKAQITTDAYGMTRLVLRYAFATIKSALPSFGEEENQAHLRRSIAGSIKTVYQQDELPETSITRKDKRCSNAWISSKIFLDHSLLEILIKVTESCFGSHFVITLGSLERLFNKTETLPVSSFCCLLSVDC
jgi:hypothetical protein